MELSHEAVKDLIAPYVLGAVSPEEEREIRAHIVSCDECMQEAESFSTVTSALALASDPAPLPAGFVDRVVAHVNDARPESSAAAAGAAPWYRRWTGWQVVATSALLVVALILGAFVVNDRKDLEQRQKVLAALLQHERGGMDLQGTTGAVAKVVPTSNGSIFVATGLHEAPSHHTYQLWLIKDDGTPVSAGTFVMQGGVAVLESHLPLSRFAKAAVTVEPSGGSQRPTTQPVITSS
jgi:anti-sigma-K factor RskA